MTGGTQFAYGGRNQADTVLVNLDFPRDADAHWGPPPGPECLIWDGLCACTGRATAAKVCHLGASWTGRSQPIVAAR